MQASAEVELSAERVEQGGTVGVRISGMTGDAVLQQVRQKYPSPFYWAGFTMID